MKYHFKAHPASRSVRRSSFAFVVCVESHGRGAERGTSDGGNQRRQSDARLQQIYTWMIHNEEDSIGGGQGGGASGSSVSWQITANAKASRIVERGLTRDGPLSRSLSYCAKDARGVYCNAALMRLSECVDAAARHGGAAHTAS